MKDYETVTKCLLCNGDIKELFSLGKTPLANEFLAEPTKQDLFPLNLVQCQKCNHVQLDTIVDQNRLFSNYLYVSGTSKVLVKHFEDYANTVMTRFFDKFSTPSDKLILDIGSNDGTFLKFFKKIKKVGIDPATNLVDEATKNGVDTISVFFNKENIEHIKKYISPYEKANVITCNNMFAHNKDLISIVKGVKELLSDSGTFIFENSYLLDMCDNNIFDVIYHEHIHHHHLTPLVSFFDKLDMKVYDVERISNQGGSIRVYVCHKSYKYEVSNNVSELLTLEKNINTKLKVFSDNIFKLKVKLNAKLQKIKHSRKTIAIYGYPAKATTLMYGLEIDPKMIEFVCEDAKLKQGLLTPGHQLKIYSTEEMYKTQPDYMLILGWNFSSSIIKNNHQYQGKWIIPLPELKEV